MSMRCLIKTYKLKGCFILVNSKCETHKWDFSHENIITYLLSPPGHSFFFLVKKTKTYD